MEPQPPHKKFRVMKSDAQLPDEASPAEAAVPTQTPGGVTKGGEAAPKLPQSKHK